MRTEIILLLNAGLKPKKVAEILNVSLNTVYYYNRALEKGKRRLREL